MPHAENQGIMPSNPVQDHIGWNGDTAHVHAKFGPKLVPLGRIGETMATLNQLTPDSGRGSRFVAANVLNNALDVVLGQCTEANWPQAPVSCSSAIRS